MAAQAIEERTAPIDAAVSDARMGSSSKSFKFGYWRKPDGSIVVGPTWAIEWVRLVEEGWEPLAKYGTFPFSDARMNDEGAVVWRWNAGTDPFYWLFQRGGAKEFTPEEIVEHGWHRKPPKGVKSFPQMAGVDVHDAQCGVCRKTFSALEERDARASLTRHETIAHKDASANNQLARSLADALQPGADSTRMVAALKSLAETQERLVKLLKGRKGA